MPTGFSDWSPAVRVEAQPGTPESFNGPALEGCPFISRDERSFYGADIYVTRQRPHGWEDPHNLGCNVNSAADEASPSPLQEPGNGKVLYFSSVRPGGLAPDADGATIGDSDLYVVG